ncbi:hypothetical protein Y032_0014g2257 [Ancylostoma ceylanicum]|uniref:Uncharacterized protein n=1 Tax=Ancylostoma ceylanicum TaxID=53326 RepID=A0A016V9Q0_9BILA|nr:hypothetical protein Y032_0014g2257 [Ancylostoma ceylanicum]
MPSSLLDQDGPVLLLRTCVLALSSPFHRRTCIRTFSQLLGLNICPYCLFKNIDGLRDCTIAAEPERGLRKERAPTERVH